MLDHLSRIQQMSTSQLPEERTTWAGVQRIGRGMPIGSVGGRDGKLRWKEGYERSSQQAWAGEGQRLQ